MKDEQRFETLGDFYLNRMIGVLDPDLDQAVTRIWKPFEGKPQEQAFDSEADILFYGGAA